ncbi:BnaAnng04780D [Brassica napus]|uniref:BnaAnng04780D protein n=1 Tax=Brassica napus TaxID=3708 RepID=A0A078HIX4_BRANA|nr:BnaAnng04780D [Brassica napus]
MAHQGQSSNGKEQHVKIQNGFH